MSPKERQSGNRTRRNDTEARLKPAASQFDQVEMVHAKAFGLAVHRSKARSVGDGVIE